jgi:serine/threonine protein phosphatase PrpC
MVVKSAGGSDVGKLREANEDSFLIAPERKLFIVADGMGGHQGGGFASKKILELVIAELDRIVNLQETTQPLQNHEERTVTQFRLLRALQRANQALFEISLKEPNLRGMGTTLTAVQFDEKYANFAHIGDSRGYLIRDGQLRQLTEDHSWVQEQVKMGVLSAEEAKNHPLKNIITRSMGHERDVKVDLLKHEFKTGDKYLLCSDGLSNMVNDEELQKIVVENSIEEAIPAMIKRANEEGGYDNITVVLLEVSD